MGTLEEVQALPGHDDRVWSVSWSPSGDMLASCSGDKTVRIWVCDAATSRWRCSAVLEEMHTRTVRSCSWSPNGKQLATASFDRTVAIWQVQGGQWEHVALLEGHESEVKGVAWHAGGSLIATCSRDKTLWIWEAAPGNEYEVVDVKHGHSQDVKAVAWHPSGEVLASASYDDDVKLWVDNDDEWICAQTLGAAEGGHSSTVWDVAFDPEGRRMASCSDDCTVKIWRCAVDQGEPRYKLASTLSGHHGRAVFSVSWSREGEYIATGCADNAIRVFGPHPAGSDEPRSGGGGDAAAAAAVAAEDESFTGRGADMDLSLQCTQAEAHALDVNCVRWHPTDSLLLASASDDGTVKLWRYHPPPS